MIERTFIQQNMRRLELENYIRLNMDRAGFTRLEIVKTPLVTRLIVNVTHPGLAIGKSGQNIKRLTKEIGEKFKIENPQLEIQEIKVPELDARATVDRLKTLLERGFSWRSIAYKVTHDISMKGAQGVELVLSGALGGKGQRKRSQRIATGYMKKTGDQVKLVDYAKITAYPKYGAIGIKLRIVRPETVFPDKIDIRELLNPKVVAEEAAEPASSASDTAPLEFEKEKVKEEAKEESAEEKEKKHKAKAAEDNKAKEKKAHAEKEAHEKPEEKKEHREEHAKKHEEKKEHIHKETEKKEEEKKDD